MNAMIPVYLVVFKTLYFLVTYERAQSTKVPADGKPFQPSVGHRFILFGPYISYDENESL